ncbi:MAG: 4Fe-4S dicluster domain-containing protein [Acidimicrobiia bacterium]|nr:4Fe-4S dicluster domain-containing protein [Acidimicrobiia bacterium]MBT8215482.1 4Fe-4S dicluster domain-containing protein [Acidimicrobiia bacterium]NNF10016.1 4Fe-4S dicluster domain-containing protein [Acidimicrobiia bacterium]NNL71690.1 4Fe-4S dicluster domain-containing protein [Acidimicrobiia bacterium]
MEAASVLERRNFNGLLDALTARGYRPIGPVLEAGRIVYGPIQRDSDLPIGKTDIHDGGMYRIADRPDDALFGYNLPSDSWKQYLFPPHSRLWTATKSNGSFTVAAEEIDPPRYALLGVRACELAAIRVQDTVFTGAFPDRQYNAVRDDVLIVGVNCGQAGGTCFCTSMGTGPQLTDGYDLVLTELLDGDHRFLVRSGTATGADILRELPLTPATPADCAEAEALIEHVSGHMGRMLDTDGIKDLLYDNAEHERWDDVATRCLACANCTMVCPTCFCVTTEDRPTLDGATAERWRTWDSCFSLGFSHIHGGPIRTSVKARYRQWMTHKLATWIDQFGTSGCVGCGRCITWCPVGIDITHEVAAIRTEEAVHAHR